MQKGLRKITGGLETEARGDPTCILRKTLGGTCTEEEKPLRKPEEYFPDYLQGRAYSTHTHPSLPQAYAF